MANINKLIIPAEISEWCDNYITYGQQIHNCFTKSHMEASLVSKAQ